MLKKRYVVLMTALCLVMLVLFNMLSGNLGYAGTMEANQANTMPQKLGPAVSYLAEEDETETYAVITGGDSGRAVQMTLSTLNYMHASHQVYERFADIPEEKLPDLTAIIVTPQNWVSLFTQADLAAYLDEGGAILFEQLPSEAYLKTHNFLSMLGITDMHSKREQTSVRFYDNILLVDEVYEDLDLTAYDVSLSQSCKIYAHEFLLPEDGHWPEWTEAINFNPLIWRNYWNGGQVQVMNGNFMDDVYGMGILAGMLSQMDTYSLMPIVNANIYSIAELPVFTRIDSPHFMEEYYRTSEKLLQEIVWPSLISMSVRTELPLTAFWTPLVEGMPAGPEQRRAESSFWLKEFTKYQFDLGVSNVKSDPTLSDETVSMLNTLDERHHFYNPRCFLAAEATPELVENLALYPDFRVVAERYPSDDRVQFDLRFASPELLVLPAISDGIELSSRDRLVMNSIASNFGYIHTQVDLSRFYAGGEWIDFDKAIEKEAAYVTAAYPWLHRVTATNGAAIASDYLCGDPVITDEDGRIRVSCEEAGMTFLLRSEFPIGHVSGGLVEEIKEDVYKVTMQAAEMTIDLRGV